MALRLKPLHAQVLVITGATSGIGLATARAASAQGARLVLNGRNGDALEALAAELGRERTAPVPGDVTSVEDTERLATVANERFGGFDTWVNNAGVSIYGRLEDVTEEDHRRLFETNFWGVVHGSLVASRELRQRGGALINVGSTLSDRAIPLQGMYSASKHAVKGFTDALRMELEADGAPVSVTLVKPGAIDTPYPQHAKSYLANAPTNPPPVYAPSVVARAILHAAQHPVRDLFVGGGGKAISLLGTMLPRTTDQVMERTMFTLQRSAHPAEDGDGLHAPASALEEHGPHASRDHGHVARSSLYTAASLHPWLTAAVTAGAAALVARATRGNGH